MTFNVVSFIQIVCDIVATKDGSLTGERRGPNDPQATTVILTNEDLHFQYQYPLRRFGPQILRHWLEVTFKLDTGKEIELEKYGKPYALNYDFTEEILRKRAAKRNIKISNFYMIGDNPESDIAGANAKNWTSILVKTGVFKPDDPENSVNGNDKNHPATHIVETFKDAIELIDNLEQQNGTYN